MKAPKLKWSVSQAPTGRFRSFEKRAFPYADYANGRPAAKIECDKSYVPDHRTATDLQLTVYVAEWFVRVDDNVLTFNWRRVHRPACSIAEAKEIARIVLERNPGLVHPDVRKY
ncbi:hypothetical protein HWB92_gp020 [Serratia phage vB_SmaA_3M]|uniref:Uncharacterized protein n=1 Tax=Serratia phage vB_SmaA_3M TaxID=2419930 RepID=A0A3G2YS03_9CAUD|nr:hypothetical protein HWB92_gp020 [Serratia phage vB_SmaA_3M]AYP28278.1 hypothetical protein 3M_020 [Serratia phage vB_SmaA_3M]